MSLTETFEHIGNYDYKNDIDLSTQDAGCRTERLCYLLCPLLKDNGTLFIIRVALLRLVGVTRGVRYKLRAKNNLGQITSPCCKTNKLPFDTPMEQVFVAPLFVG